jgi:Zn-finger nucleic acid-binding protein
MPRMADRTDNLTCPKCESPMRSYERSGIVIDQCTGCRGVFLDRGELERLVDAEGDFYAEDDSRREPAREEHGGTPKKKKKREFLSDFLDFG